MTAGDNASASASSKNKEGGTMPQISRSTEDEHGSHTTKTTETHDSDGKKDTKIVSKDRVRRRIRRVMSSKQSLPKLAARLLRLEVRLLVWRVGRGWRVLSESGVNINSISGSVRRLHIILDKHRE
jgi:hypothetical protein